MIESCLIIPQWIFAMVGLFMIAASAVLVWRDQDTFPLAIIVCLMAIALIGFGLHPYLPCVVVAP